MTEEQINKAIARIILSTKRKSRQYSLFEIALDIEALKTAKGGMSHIAKIIGVSAGMLNQFLSVLKLPESVIDLVKERKIDSVSMVHHLSKFNEPDVFKLAELLAANKLSSQDLRILIPYRKQFKIEPIIDLVEKIHSSKNMKVSVIRINKDDTLKSIGELDSIFVNQVGRENVIKVVENNNFIDVKLSKEGEKTLRRKAKDSSVTFEELITILIN